MDLKTYVSLALCTESVPGWIPQEKRAGLRFTHAVLGLQSELVELDEALGGTDTLAVVEELGDLSWYWAVLADVAGIELVGSVVFSDAPFDARLGSLLHQGRRALLGPLSLEVSHLANTGKRIVFYGKNELADAEARRQVLVSHARIGHWIYTVARATGVGAGEVRARNIQKLETRYPSKFDAYRAVHRDLGAEREALEGPAT